MLWYLLFQYCARHEPTNCGVVAMPGGVYLAEWQCQINAQSFPKQVATKHFCWPREVIALDRGQS